MSGISTLLFKFLQKRFGNFDWGNGSVIRTLVAEPVVELSEQAVSAVNNVYNSINIQALLDSPEEHADDIDKLFKSMGLSTPTATVSTGRVRLLLDSDDSFIIPAGASFEYNDVTLMTAQAYTARVIDPVNPEDESTDTILEISPVDPVVLNGNMTATAYEVIVPVRSITTGINLSEGTELTWNGITTGIYSATVYSTITGGINDYTASQKINLIRQQLFPAAVSAQESVLHAINTNTPDLAVDCAFAPTSPVGYTDVYVKTTAVPSTWRIKDCSIAATAETGVFSLTVPAAGIAYVKRIVITAVVNGVPQDTYYPVLSFTRNGHVATITFNGGTGTGAPSGGDLVDVEVFGLSTMVDVQQALDVYTENTGLNLIACTPELASLQLYIPVASGVVSTAAGTTVAAAINSSLLNATGIGDSMLRPLLATQGISMAGNGTYTIKRYRDGAGKVNLGTADTGLLSAGGKPYAIYSHNDQVTLDNVQTV